MFVMVTVVIIVLLFQLVDKLTTDEDIQDVEFDLNDVCSLTVGI